MKNVLPYNILIISNKPPYPIMDGGCFAMSRFEKLVSKCFKEVSYFAISTPKHPFKESNLPDNWILNQNYFTEFIDTRIQNKHVLKYFAGSSIRAARFYSTAIEKKIIDLINIKKIDIVFFESIYSAVYLPAIKKRGKIRTFIRAHNIEHQIWERHFNSMPKGLKRLAFRSETTRLKSFEDKCLESTDGNIFISENDLSYYKQELKKRNAISLPVQMVSNPSPYIKQNHLTLFHIGAMDWMPNVVGVRNFIQHIFPQILTSLPSVHLHLAGKAMPSQIFDEQNKHITVHGEVESAEGFMKNYDILVVPIESGSGIRIKILEAMALGKPVISTQAGIEGIGATNGVEYLQVNNNEDWINAVNFLNDEDNYAKMSAQSVEFIAKNYSESALISKLIPFVKNNIVE